MDPLGTSGSQDGDVEPSGALSWWAWGGGAESQVAEAPGTFRERLEKFVYWNFRSVDTLRFPTPFLCSPVTVPNCFVSVKILSPSRVGMGGKTFGFTVGSFLSQTRNPSIQTPTFTD